MPKAATLNAEPKRGKPFEKGNPGGPGNPWAGRLQQYRKALYEVATPENVKAVFAAMITKAVKDKDVAAATLIGKWCGLEKIQIDIEGLGLTSIVSNLTDDEKKNLLLKIEERNGFKPSEK